MAKKSSGRFKYRGDKRSVESVHRKSKQSGGLYDSYIVSDAPMLKIKEGDTTLRILPPSWDEADDKVWGDGWDIGIWVHFSVGPDGGTYLCLDKMRGEMCPICDARRDADDDDERNQLKPSWRALAWVIDRDNEKAGPQVWSMPVSLFREINLRSIDKKHNTPIPIDHPDEGYDITFAREGTGIKTKYEAFEVDRDPSPLHDDEDVQDKWIEYIEKNTLPGILNFYDAEHIEDVLYGRKSGKSGSSDDSDDSPKRGRSRRARDEDEDEDDDDEEDRTSRSRTRRSRRDDDESEKDPLPDEELDEDEDEEEEEDHTSRSRTRRRRSSSDDDESEEDDDEDEGPSRQAREKLDGLKNKRGRRRRR